LTAKLKPTLGAGLFVGALAMLLILLVPSSEAAVCTGTATTYSCKDTLETLGPTYKWNSISATGAAPTWGTGEDVTQSVPIGFTFTYFGAPYTNVWIHSNGLLAFGASPGGAWPAYQYPDNFNPANSFGGYHTDLRTPTGTYRYQTLGSAPDRVFVFEVNGVQHFNSAANLATFQMMLYETSNLMEVHWNSVSNPTGTGGRSAAAGIQNGASTPLGLNYQFGTWSRTTQAVQYRPTGLAPTITADPGYSVLEDNILTVPAVSGVLANDVPLGNAPIEAVLDTTTSNGLLTLNADGSFTYTPNADFFGSDSFTYKLKDAWNTVGYSTTATVTITVNAVNDAPKITAGAATLTINEDAGPQSPTWASSISPGPPNESTQTLTITTTNDNNGLFAVQPSLSAGGVLSYTPKADEHGSAVVTMTLKDNGGTANGGIDTTVVSMTIVVNSVNDRPTLTLGSSKVHNEDAPAQTFPGFATGISAGPPNEAAQVLTLTTVASVPGLFASGGLPNIDLATGTLTYTPKPNEFGLTTVTVTLKDDGGTAGGGQDTVVRTFTITINSVNDAPVVTLGAPAVVNEDAPAQVLANWASLSPGPANEASQLLTITLTNNNNGLFVSYGQPELAPDGTLRFEPMPEKSGTADVTLTVRDNGGTANGGIDTTILFFTITVNYVNDAPLLVLGPSVTVAEDAAAQTMSGWLAMRSPGPPEESSQTTTLTVGVDLPSLFTPSGQPAIASDGTLTFTPAPDAFGVATVTVSLQDSGGTANGGVDLTVRQFTITITPVNDAPIITLGTAPVVPEDAGLQNFVSWATGIAPGPPNENTQALTVTVSSTNAGLFAATGQPKLTVIAGTATLEFQSAPDQFGTSTVTIALRDDGVPVRETVVNFVITITPVNDLPTATLGPHPVVLEDAGPVILPGWATGISPGPANEASQTLTITNGPLDLAMFTADGQPSLAPDGTLSFTTAANAFGVYNGMFTFTDSGGPPALLLPYSITITEVNDGPVVASETYEFWVGGGPYTRDLLANDVDADGDALSMTLDTTGVVGAIVLTPPGTIEYTLPPGFVGTEVLRYTVSDGRGGSAPGTATLRIRPDPDPRPDSFSMFEDTSLVDANVKANDETGSGATITIISVTQGAHGSVTLGASNLPTYTPDPDYFGTDTFTYTLTNGFSTTVTVTVVNINDAPTAVADSFTIWENMTATVLDILANDLDPDGDVLGLSAPFPTTTTGTLTHNGVRFTYTPNANYRGTFTLPYRISDGGGLTSDAVATVTVLNPATAQVRMWSDDSTFCVGKPAAFHARGHLRDRSPVSYAWKAGSLTATSTDPSFTFTTPGTVVVNATVTFGGGAKGYAERTITVFGCTPPVTSFSTTVTGMTAKFRDASRPSYGTLSAWSWDFGDGTGSSLQHPSHTYEAPGTYTVTLVATNSEGNSADFSQNIVIAAPTSAATVPTAAPTPTSAPPATATTTVTATVTSAPAVQPTPTDTGTTGSGTTVTDTTGSGTTVTDTTGSGIKTGSSNQAGGAGTPREQPQSIPEAGGLTTAEVTMVGGALAVLGLLVGIAVMLAVMLVRRRRS
jgi:VCBS repeat-containing protein